jgi:hypothetical protein
MNTRGLTLINEIGAALKASGVHHEEPLTAPSGSRVVRVEIDTEHGVYGTVFFADDDDPIIRCISVFPHKAALERCDAVAAVMLRSNFILAAGAFGVDFDSGTMRFWTMTPVIDEDSVPAIAMIETCMRAINEFAADINSAAGLPIS